MTLTRLMTVCGLLSACLATSAVHAAPPASHPAVQRALGLLKANAADSADDEFVATDILVDADGAEHVRFDRRHKGLPVIGGDVVVHGDGKGRLKSRSDTLRGAPALDTVPTLDDDAAAQYAATLFDATPSGAPAKTRLVVYARGAQPQLAWDVLLTGDKRDGTPSETHFLVSAHGQQLLDRWDDIKTADATGSGKSLLSGTVTLHTDSQSTGFALRDLTRGSHYVTDMKNRTNGNGTLFSDADNVWGNFATSDTVTIGVDAAYGQNKTFDFYKTAFGRNGIANDGRGAYSRVHYSRRYVNAFWSDSCFCMTYGDGDGATYLPLVAMDVAGHEMTHGVTANTAALIYSGESGGLNEGTSDIFGTLVEHSAANAAVPGSTPNYLIGERIYATQKTSTTPTKALRFMFKPSLDGASPDCYSSSIGSLDVHYSSGVANHFFYLLAEGTVVPAGFTGSVTTAQLTCNATTFGGIGRDAAGKIYYRALTVYMTSNTNYAAARQATLKAAADLYGSGSAEQTAVARAWSAVSVN